MNRRDSKAIQSRLIPGSRQDPDLDIDRVAQGSIRDLASPARDNKPAYVTGDIRTALHLKLPQHVVNMVLDRRQRDGERPRDLLVRPSSLDQLCDLRLARRQ